MHPKSIKQCPNCSRIVAGNSASLSKYVKYICLMYLAAYIYVMCVCVCVYIYNAYIDTSIGKRVKDSEKQQMRYNLAIWKDTGLT